MTTLNEAELIDNAKNGAVVYIKVVKSTNGKGFNLFVNLSWKEGDLLLITQQRKPRTWANLDRLVAHIEKHYQQVENLTIFLRGKKHDESKRNPDEGS